ncbi:MAG: sigma factor [Planctomycetota bacterium]
MANPITATRASLLLRLQNANDVQAWDEFTQIYGPVIYRIALSKGLQAADAENLVQEVFMAVAKAIGDWLERNDRGSFRAWLLRIARNQTINMLTRRGTRPLGDDGSRAASMMANLHAPNELTRELDLEYQEALASPSAAVRSLASRAMIRGSAIDEATAIKILSDSDFGVRWQTVMGLIDTHNPAAFPALIDLIPDASEQDAIHLAKLLRHIAGSGPSLQTEGGQSEGLASKEEWLAWYSKNGHRITSEQISHGYSLVYNDTHIGELDLMGERVWMAEVRSKMKYNFHHIGTKVELLSNGNFLVNDAVQLLEFSRAGTLLEKHEFPKRIVSFRRIENGHILVAARTSLYRLNQSGRIVELYAHSLGNFRSVVGNTNGGFALMGSVYIPRPSRPIEEIRGELDKGPIPTGELLEFDGNGSIIRKSRLSQDEHGDNNWCIVMLSGGKVLVSRHRDVVELNQQRKVTRTFAKPDFTPDRVSQLSNGNILVSAFGNVQEYSMDGERRASMRFAKPFIFVARR